MWVGARGKYIVDEKVLSVLPKHAIIMHPLPRLDEITVNVDSDPRAAYFRQAKNGLDIRMAILKLLLLGWGERTAIKVWDYVIIFGGSYNDSMSSYLTA
ncbi:hypothetical protein QJS10_CPB14g00109 [Acorus calamus]|uniref:Aspartate/ornithine carbamoyltransferase Asp/Orn-binding domain-containing protein n=1 Tax=Acorus calamus TaxID=4465 RepID=A0AAV9DDU7_ACOCL|nr:hypothetical protein QJS10_CPB14g00109 [Acorus calamus]